MGEAEAFSWNGQLHSHLCLFCAGELERLEQPRAPCAECPSVTYVDDKTSAPECWRECQSLRLPGSVVDLCSQDVMWQEGVQRSGPLALARLRHRELCRRCPQSQEGPVSRLPPPGKLPVSALSHHFCHFAYSGEPRQLPASTSKRQKAIKSLFEEQ